MKFSVGILGAVISAAVFTSTASAQETERRDCEPLYSQRIAEAAIVAEARLSSEAARSLANQLDSALGDRDAIDASLDARYSVVAAGGLMQSAYLSTIGSYFCYLEVEWANDPEKLEVLDEARNDLIDSLEDMFDADVWQIGARDIRRELRGELRNGERRGRFERGVVTEILPEHNFDRVKLTEITARANFPGVDLGICAGILQRSIRAVDPTMLAELQGARRVVINFLERSERNANLRMWRTVNAYMNDQLSLSQVTRNEPLTREQVVCVNRVAQEAAVVESRAVELLESGEEVTREAIATPAEGETVEPEPSVAEGSSSPVVPASEPTM